MKLAIEKISEDSEVQYFIRDKDYKWHISYDEMLSFLQSSLDAKLLRTADDLWTEAALLEIRGFQIKLVHDDLLGPYVAAVGKEPSIHTQVEGLIQEIVNLLEANPSLGHLAKSK